MKYCLFLAASAVLVAQGQVPPDLAGDGVWVPRHVADMANGSDVPLQSWANAKFQENSGKQSETDRRCLPPGVPRIMLQARPFEIVQTANRILFMYEGGGHVWRQIWMDGRDHPKDPNPDWLGHSIGHWEGTTLVVDTVGFNDRTWLDDAGHPHTEQLHVIEKFTRANRAAMQYEVTIDDPGAYTKSWNSSSILSLQPGEKLAEDICLDKTSK
jgi:hypothetical protein